jgi:hypothetical protein
MEINHSSGFKLRLIAAASLQPLRESNPPIPESGCPFRVWLAATAIPQACFGLFPQE